MLSTYQYHICLLQWLLYGHINLSRAAMHGHSTIFHKHLITTEDTIFTATRPISKLCLKEEEAPAKGKGVPASRVEAQVKVIVK